MKLNSNDFIKVKNEKLIKWDEPNGEGCMVSDKITKESFKVGYMYREEPVAGYPDSGWRFLAGNEDDDYMNNSNNYHIFSLNTICNYDKDIIPYLKGEALKIAYDEEFKLEYLSEVFMEATDTEKIELFKEWRTKENGYK